MQSPDDGLFKLIYDSLILPVAALLAWLWNHMTSRIGQVEENQARVLQRMEYKQDDQGKKLDLLLLETAKNIHREEFNHTTKEIHQRINELEKRKEDKKH